MDRSADGTTVLGDRYVLGEVIGRGGMAEVHRATDTVLDRDVAVKLLREATDDPSDRARFIAEAKTLARLNHAGLVTVLDAGTASDRPYLVMELIDGPNLAELSTGAPFELTRVLTIGSQVAEGLAHAHAAGVVHRDVKPSNIMLGKDGRVWLTDFGIARLIGDSAHHTRTGTTIGSPAYLSPEQVRGQEVTTATDVYSLALVLLELLTGERAFPQPPAEAALARLSTPPRVPDELSPGWRSLLHRMTALEPAERPSAADVASELQALATGQEGTTAGAAATAVMAAEVEPTQPLATSGDSRSPGRWPRIAAAGALAVVVLVVALLLLVPGGDDDSGVPDGVPPALEQPLGDLHDAVEGGS